MKRKNASKHLAAAIIATVLIVSTLQLNCGEVVPPEYSLSISVESPRMVGQSSSIVVSAYDNEDNPVSGASISLMALAMKGEYTWDYEVELALSDRGDGSYTSSLTSTWGGTYRIIASIDDATAASEIVFETGPAVNLVAASTPPQPGSNCYTSTVSFYSADAYGNSLSPDEVHPVISPTNGWYVENLRSDPNGLFNFDLVTTDRLGTAYVTISDNTTGISASLSVDFPPLYFETEDHYYPLSLEVISPEDENAELEATLGEDKMSLKIGAFIPALSEPVSPEVPSPDIIYPELPSYEVPYYEMTLEYDSSALQLLGVRDWDVTDDFPTPNLTILSENSFKLSQSGSAFPGGLDLAIVDFEPLERGEKTEVTLSGGFFSVGVPELPPYELLNVPAQNATVKAPKLLFVWVKKWSIEGCNATKDDVEKEFKATEKNFANATKECKLDWKLLFGVRVNNISKQDWTTYAGADGKLTINETVDMMKKKNKDPEKYTNIYNVPNCTLPNGALGQWYAKNLTGAGGPGGIVIDQTKDFDNLTLMHELMHEFSKSRVKDSPAVNATAQGGRKPGNIMSYNATGGNISNEQGDIINKELEKRAEAIDIDGDGKADYYRYNPQKDNPGHDVAGSTTLVREMAILSPVVLVSALAVIWLRKRAGKAKRGAS